LKHFSFFQRIFWRLYFCMVKYLSFHNSPFALKYFLMLMARPQCDTPLFLILWLKVQRGASIGECPMFQKSWWCGQLMWLLYKRKKKRYEHIHELINMNHNTIGSRWKEENICQSIWDKVKCYWELFGGTCQEFGNSLLWHPLPTPIKEQKKKFEWKVDYPSGKWRLYHPLSIPNTTWCLYFTRLIYS